MRAFVFPQTINSVTQFAFKTYDKNPKQARQTALRVHFEDAPYSFFDKFKEFSDKTQDILQKLKEFFEKL